MIEQMVIAIVVSRFSDLGCSVTSIFLPQSTIGKKMLTGTFTYNALPAKTLK